MIQTLIENRWLVALCGVLDAIISVIYFIMYTSGDGPNFPGWYGTAVFQSSRLRKKADSGVTQDGTGSSCIHARR